MTLKRKIMILTGTRADYGLLKNIISKVHSHASLELKLVVTGSHLSSAHGSTIKEIEEDGFPIAYKLPILETSSSVVHSTALAMDGLNSILLKDRPDILLVLGDRYESFAACTAALFNNIPVAHVHGGELTFGAIDDALRHSMTKMAWWHFTSAEEYKKRVIHLGEAPDRVYNVGATAVDALANIDVSSTELEDFLGIKLVSPIVLATFHPETLSPGKATDHVMELWEGLKDSKPGTVIFTKANADSEGSIVNDLLSELIAKVEIPNSVLVSSLGQRRYLGLLKLADVGLGNSSSLVIEAPMLNTPSVNVGRRQEGRLRSPSILDVAYDSSEITKALNKAFSLEFKNSLKGKAHPFGTPGVADRIVTILASASLPKNLVKGFYE